jgi:uncharacterized protein (TIGR02996 family)
MMSVITEEEAFLSAIRADPEDAARRLIYADWLEEHADPRAQYLRMLSALDDVEVHSPEAADLLVRMQELQVKEAIARPWILLMCRGRITRLLHAFQAGVPRDDWPKNDAFRELARRHDALPIYADMGGVMLLTPDGEVLGIGHDDERPQPEIDQGWRLIGLASAAEFFPELRPLLPPRPCTAMPCPQCEGNGVKRYPVEVGRGISTCGKCWGMGWLPSKPADAVSCVGCGGTGRRQRQYVGGSYETSCGQCGGLGWPNDRA